MYGLIITQNEERDFKREKEILKGKKMNEIRVVKNPAKKLPKNLFEILALVTYEAMLRAEKQEEKKKLA